MKQQTAWPLDIRWLILGLVLLSVLATLANSLTMAYRVQRDALIEHALASNSAYASKVASSLSEFLRSTQSHLRFSASELGKHWGDASSLREEAVRMQTQDIDFNSIAIVDSNGKVLQAYPDALQIIGTTLRSESIQQALQTRRPQISPAYVSVAGNLVVFISQPIFDASGHFLGTVGGSVYLRKQSALHTVISSHFHHEGTFAFVADGNRRLLFHPEQNRIGEKLDWSKTVDAALRGESGAMEVPNYLGIPMLAGYAHVESANWAVVAQQPRKIALAPLGRLMRDMILEMVPAGLVGLILVWYGTALIARPLHELASIAEQLSAPQTTERLKAVNAWYPDASAIRQAMLAGVQLLQQKLGRLRHEAQSDSLTGLANRRAMDALLQLLEQTGQEYSVLALDIDHFKRVNDTYGHDVGDVALQQVAAVLQEYTRAGDMACRAGGEEFTLILPDTSLATALAIAERIRVALAAREIPQIGLITVSIGVASRDSEGELAEATLKRADRCLYQAKKGGRNRVESFGGG